MMMVRMKIIRRNTCRWRVAGLLLLFLWLLTGQRHAETAAQTEQCIVDEVICVVPQAWTEAALRDHLGDQTLAAWSEGDILHIVLEAEAGQVTTMGTFSINLHQLPATNLWTISLRIDDLHQALINCWFTLAPADGSTGGRSTAASGIVRSPVEPLIWRGADAPPAPVVAATLTGTITTTSLRIEDLSETRGVTVYTPPVAATQAAASRYPVIYAADGQSVESFAYVLEPLILSGELPPLLLVGVHSENSTRTEEYLLDQGDQQSERFTAHERFFTETVRTWAEATYRASQAREERAVFGFSNGGHFAAAMSLRHPDLYGYSFAFSVAGNPALLTAGVDAVVLTDSVLPAFYLAAGTLEIPFLRSTRLVASALETAGINFELEQRVSGHDFTMWTETLIRAARWAFADPTGRR